jgi:hypothetical protein
MGNLHRGLILYSGAPATGSSVGRTRGSGERGARDSRKTALCGYCMLAGRQMPRLAWIAVVALLLTDGLAYGVPQTPPSLSAVWEAGGIIRLEDGRHVSRVNLRQDIVGCLGQLYDPTTGERLGEGEGSSRVLDVTTNGGRRFVLLSAVAAANCNIQGRCGAAAEPNVTLIWLEIRADLSVVNKQTFAVIDCGASRGVDATDDWPDKLRVVNGALTVTFHEFGASADVNGTVSYSRRTAGRGLIVSRQRPRE